MLYDLTVDETVFRKLAEWHHKGRGIRRWSNLEIGGCGAQHVFTPGGVDKPGWRYGESELVDFNSLLVSVFVPRLTFNGRVAKHYWGRDLADVSRKKAERLQQPGETYFFTFDIVGYCSPIARVEIGTEKVIPCYSLAPTTGEEGEPIDADSQSPG